MSILNTKGKCYTLSWPARKHFILGLSWRCIVYFYPNLQFQYLLVSISILFLWLQIFCKLGSFAASALVIPLVHYVCVYLNRRYHISVKFLHRLTAGQVVMIVSAALYMITTHSYNYGEAFYMIILFEIHMNKAYQKVSHNASFGIPKHIQSMRAYTMCYGFDWEILGSLVENCFMRLLSTFLIGFTDVFMQIKVWFKRNRLVIIDVLVLCVVWAI